ncbi:ribose-phosphate diphosphokinase [Desulfococcus multivorans]|uniref:Ribose-phosphate pyrophosphokinase n=1 Tax=Desulfococcus multivorans DSM 2059 TaxID=1121405 RepID=S7UPD3_DESML|nr:ribose-phosphate pyrophosphokinase [Desulfococcus multivorans]AQV01722.1 phosphoribosylpyrophosphate synthetase [Desulfococcus multivorans]EPR34173.1 Ribose-phosphate pyrophosphokinase [Desulfococcus multivorans DSM 2059]SKA19747.1 ribose-phosphate pyrophosphokinase [Desulfococcus multivorans DSM 2059]
MNNEITIFSGNSNPDLAAKICNYLELPLGGAKVKTFSDGEIQIEINENIRARDVFVVQSTCRPVNDNLVELLLMLDACKRSSAKRVTAVIPYYGYGRQDKKVAPRVPISARLVADMITLAGADRVITMDLHAGQIQGFFNIPVDNLFATPVVLDHIRSKFNLEDVVIVSPDAGGVERARAFAKRLDAGLAIIDKRRDAPNEAKAMAVIGNVKDKVVIILDDMADTAGTLTEAAGALVKNGVKEVHACCTHPVLSGPAISRIRNSDLKSIVVTDTIPLSQDAKVCEKISVLTISKLFGEAIIRSHEGDSVTSLFV